MGWRRQPRDTGWRMVAPGANPGQVRVRRVGELVQIQINGFTPDDRTAPTIEVAALPVGFRPALFTVWKGSLNLNPATLKPNARFLVDSLGSARITDHETPTGPLYGSFFWFTRDPWPTTLPGVAA